MSETVVVAKDVRVQNREATQYGSFGDLLLAAFTAQYTKALHLLGLCILSINTNLDSSIKGKSQIRN
jgi:hypothetical protein